jgi:hypothetical protein
MIERLRVPWDCFPKYARDRKEIEAEHPVAGSDGVEKYSRLIVRARSRSSTGYWTDGAR